MSTLGLFLITIIFAICFFMAEYIFSRNEEVGKFKNDLNNRGYQVCKSFLDNIDPIHISDWDFHCKMKEYDILSKTYDSINDISYYKMLLSFKPLEEEYWLTEEQMDFLARNLR